MIAHALSILQKELEAHLNLYGNGNGSATARVALFNLAEGLSGENQYSTEAKEKIVIGVVNSREEKTLKNVPNYVRNDVTLKASYENAPIFLNFYILVAATHEKYETALLHLSRAIRFFQAKNVFTHENVTPTFLDVQLPMTDMDQLETFKLIMDFYSPTLEEVNHLWGTLGGKQYPFALYMMRILELKFRIVQSESGLITEVVNSFSNKKTNN